MACAGEDLQILINHHQIYESFMEVVQRNHEHIGENNGAVFCDFVRRCYGVQAAVGIRRHLRENDKGSFVRMLKQVSSCADQFTLEFYKEQFPLEDGEGEWREPTFQKYRGTGNAIDRQIIDGDVAELTRLGEQIGTFVDRRLAHQDPRGCDVEVTYKDLDTAIGNFNRVYCGYAPLLNGNSVRTLACSILFDWKKVFREPLDVVARGKP